MKTPSNRPYIFTQKITIKICVLAERSAPRVSAQHERLGAR
jgi:hypothetical protein